MKYLMLFLSLKNNHAIIYSKCGNQLFEKAINHLALAQLITVKKTNAN